MKSVSVPVIPAERPGWGPSGRPLHEGRGWDISSSSNCRVRISYCTLLARTVTCLYFHTSCIILKWLNITVYIFILYSSVHFGRMQGSYCERNRKYVSWTMAVDELRKFGVSQFKVHEYRLVFFWSLDLGVQTPEYGRTRRREDGRTRRREDETTRGREDETTRGRENGTTGEREDERTRGREDGLSAIGPAADLMTSPHQLFLLLGLL